MACYEENHMAENLESSLKTFENLYSLKPVKNIRLPKSIKPESYNLKIIPYIWEGNLIINNSILIFTNFKLYK